MAAVSGFAAADVSPGAAVIAVSERAESDFATVSLAGRLSGNISWDSPAAAANRMPVPGRRKLFKRNDGNASRIMPDDRFKVEKRPAGKPGRKRSRLKAA